jgi:hypothetical protein
MLYGMAGAAKTAGAQQGAGKGDDMSDLSLERRVTRLEREYRWLKLGTVGALAVVVGLVCVAATERAQEVVRAGKFVVVDAEGKARAMLSALPQGTGLSLNDEKGKVRASLSVLANGRPFLRASNKTGQGLV